MSAEVPQFYAGTSLSDIRAWVARAKKAASHRVSLYSKVQDQEAERQPCQDLELALLINPLQRGGDVNWIKGIEDDWKEFDCQPDVTVEHLKQEHGWHFYHIRYRGAQLADDVRLCDLKSDCVELVKDLPDTWLRTRTSCLKSKILTLAELTKWFIPKSLDTEPSADLDLLQAAIHNFNTAKSYAIRVPRRSSSLHVVEASKANQVVDLSGRAPELSQGLNYSLRSPQGEK